MLYYRDNGSGYKIEPFEKGKLDYSQMAALKCLLRIATGITTVDVYKKLEI